MPSFRFSQRAARLKSSAIRDLLKITEEPAVISFAGGLPSPLTFPVEVMREAAQRVLTEQPHAALQYAPTEGYGPLREWVGQQHGVAASRVLITTGSQQALDLLARVLIDPGSPVLVEDPTYLGALQPFSLAGATYRTVPCDAGGIVPGAITRERVAHARLMYLIPNFQNPTGWRLSAERRAQLLRALDDAGGGDVAVVEDDPYGELTYDGRSLPTLLSMAPDRVVYLGSFSKIVAPGLRVGYAIAPEPLLRKMVQAKQASDLHTAGLPQRMIYEALRTGFLPAHIQTIRTRYRAQRDAMRAALQKHCADRLTWNMPEGGMFLWARAAHGVDTQALLQDALAPPDGARVAFVPGTPFYAGTPERDTMRLSFVTVPPPRITEGVAQLARALERMAATARSWVAADAASRVHGYTAPGETRPRHAPPRPPSGSPFHVP